MMNDASNTKSDTQVIFDEWAMYQKKIMGKRQPRLTKTRTTIIELALKKKSKNDLIKIITYIHCGDDQYSKMMRGDNEFGKDYTRLETLFRESKLQDKVRRANIWSSKQKPLAEDVYVPFELGERDDDVV